MGMKSICNIKVSSLNTAKTICAGISRVESATVSAVGSGYLVGEILSVAGGTALVVAKLRVLTINHLGGVTSVDIRQDDHQGAYTSKPSDAVSVTGGTGSGATFTLTWRDNTAPGGCNVALVQAQAQDVYYRLDGGTPVAGTATGTVLKAAGLGSISLVLYDAQIYTAKFIEATTSATMYVEFARG